MPTLPLPASSSAPEPAVCVRQGPVRPERCFPGSTHLLFSRIKWTVIKYLLSASGDEYNFLHFPGLSICSQIFVSTYYVSVSVSGTLIKTAVIQMSEGRAGAAPVPTG